MLTLNSIKRSELFDTRHWRSICDVTLTLKQARKGDSGHWFPLNWYQCGQAFRLFLNLLNRGVYKNAGRRFGKKIRVISILEKDPFGRWHIHAALEPPRHIAPEEFERLVRKCWGKTDWGYREIAVRSNADRGWIDYMLKRRGKSGFEHPLDCIDWFSLNNPVADV